MGPYRSISNRWTNNEGLVDIKKEYNLYFYSSTATIVCSRNTVSESSHISFFCGGGPFCEVVQQPENTHGELTGPLEWPACLCLQFKITDLTLSFQVPCGCMNILFAQVFFCLWLVIGTYILLFFFRWFVGLICVRKYVTLSIGNKLYSRHDLYFYFSCQTSLSMLSCDCIESAKFIHGTLSLAKLVYYSIRCYHTGPEWTWEQWQWRSTPHSPNLQHYWSHTLRWFNVVSKVRWDLTLLQRRSRCILQSQPTELYPYLE